MVRRLFWAEKLRMPVHSAPSRPSATCCSQDHSSGSDFRSQCAMAWYGTIARHHAHAAVPRPGAFPRRADVARAAGARVRRGVRLRARGRGAARLPRPRRAVQPALPGPDTLAPRRDDVRRGDVVILAGKNGGKARTMRRLHEAGFHVLADKPWLVEPGDLEHVRV